LKKTNDHKKNCVKNEFPEGTTPTKGGRPKEEKNVRQTKKEREPKESNRKGRQEGGIRKRKPETDFINPIPIQEGGSRRMRMGSSDIGGKTCSHRQKPTPEQIHIEKYKVE